MQIVRRQGPHTLNMFLPSQGAFDRMRPDGWSQAMNETPAGEMMKRDDRLTVVGCERSTVSFTKVSGSSKHPFTCSERSHNFVSVHDRHTPATALNQTALTKPTTARRGSVHIGGSKSDTYAHAGETQMISAYILWQKLKNWQRFLSW